MDIEIRPSRAEGTVKAPPSKSAAHRLLLCAGLANGTSTVRNVAFSEDILATLDVLKALGAEIGIDGDTVTFTPAPQTENGLQTSYSLTFDGKGGIRDVLREHAIEDGTKPVKLIELEVKNLAMDRANNPKNYTDSTYQKALSKIKGGELKDGKIPTLTIVIKPTDNASYKNMVDALDEMQILSIGTYVIDKISPDDEKLLEKKGVKM